MLRRKVLFLCTCALAAALSLVSVLDGAGFRRYLRLREEMRALAQRNSELRTQNELLGRQIQALRGDPRALERAAREELGFIAPGEVVINLE
jgi:cell division protein FtsB